MCTEEVDENNIFFRLEIIISKNKRHAYSFHSAMTMEGGDTGWWPSKWDHRVYNIWLAALYGL